MMKYNTIKETAKIWGISEQLVRRYCRQGRIPDLIQEDGNWLIPEGTKKPQSRKGKEPEPLTPLAKKITYQRNKNNHFGIYEYIQVNLAYSSNRMASNRLTRQQVEEVYRTNKVATAFEPMKVDDLIEVLNHFICVQYVVDNISAPLTPSFVKKLHWLLTYGTYADRKHKTCCGEFRKEPSKIGVFPKEINRELINLIKDYEQQPADMDRILDFHVRFERIRPFDDYNGRVGRVIMLKDCLRHGVVPFIIDDKHRGEYNRGITQWDTNPETLRSVSLRAQDRFQAHMELCKLMQHRRPIINR